MFLIWCWILKFSRTLSLYCTEIFFNLTKREPSDYITLTLGLIYGFKTCFLLETALYKYIEWQCLISSGYINSLMRLNWIDQISSSASQAKIKNFIGGNREVRYLYRITKIKRFIAELYPKGLLVLMIQLGLGKYLVVNSPYIWKR